MLNELNKPVDAEGIRKSVSFRQTAAVVSAIVAALLWLIVIVILVVAVAEPWDRGTSLVAAAQFLILASVSSLGVMGFCQSWRSRRRINILKLYVILQLFIDGLLFVLMLAEILGTDKLSKAGHWLLFAAWLAFLNLPLLLIAGNGKWFPKLEPLPPTDASGKYLHCIRCNYDLRGTPGGTCPECGAPVMASDASPSMLNA